MRKLLSLALVLVITCFQLPSVLVRSAGSLSQASSPSNTLSFQDPFPEYSLDDLQDMPLVTNLHYDFAKPSPSWQQLVAGDSPASFKQVQYKLADGVLDITGSDDVIGQIASEGQLLAGSSLQKQKPTQIIAEGGYLTKSVLNTVAAQQGRTVTDGLVVVDKASRTAFKVVAPTVHTGIYEMNSELLNMVSALQNTYSIARPQLQEIFQDFSLGGEDGETIELTWGNISGFAPNIEQSMVFSDQSSVRQLSLEEMYQGYEHIYGDKLVDLKFDNTLLDAQTSSGVKIKVEVSGGIGIQKLLVNAKYTRFSGYRFAVTLNQESYLTVELTAAISEEIRIPVIGIDAGIGDVGRVTGGVFVIVGLDGNLRLEIAAREFTSTTIGVRGKTAAYIPCSIRPEFSQTIKGEGDVNLTGKVDGYIKFGPMLGIELFGYDLVGAGVFLGTGVQVEATDYELDIELYGMLNVYLDFLGKHFNLINLRPTLWEKKQMNTAGHRVTFMEAYVYPGRVSGVIEKEVPSGPGSEDGFAPVANMPYRIWVVPAGEPFNPSSPGDLNNPKIRRYPSSGFAKTNSDGVFFQKNDTILAGGERAFVEFQINGQSYFSNGAEATLPFEKYTITQVDYFNDFIVGQVQPIRVINYNAPANDADQRYELYYYANSPLQVRHYFYTTSDFCIDTGGVAYARTDEFGNFDTRDAFVDDTGAAVPHWKFDVRPDADKWIHFDAFRVKLILDYRGATISGEVPFSATTTMSFTRTVSEVPDSHKRFTEGDKIIDQMAYDEYIYVINPLGTLAVAEDEFCYVALPFSTQDFHTGLVDYRHVPVSILGSLWQTGAPDVKTPAKKLLPVLDANGNPTGATLFYQRVYVEWVWQAHPNPVKITSVDHAGIDVSGGSFQVTATGYAPFAFSLTDAPAGVTIDRNSGLLNVADGTPAATYTFAVRAEENRDAYQVTLPDGTVIDQSKLLGPYEGNDPSPPDEQLFTLIVSEPLTPPTEPTTAPTPTPTAAPRTRPNINAASHNYNFTMIEGGRNLSVQVAASGSTPITWSLRADDQYPDTPFPDSASINASTGLLSIGSNLAPGIYRFTIRAQNDVGLDDQDCSLTVNGVAPVIRKEEHNYAFEIFKKKEDVNIPINATGSLPMIWSLEQTGSEPLPEALTIDPQTGVLTIRKAISVGQYNFTIRAANDYGYDTQDCTLKVNYALPLLQGNTTASPLASHDYRKDFFTDTPALNQDFFVSDDPAPFDFSALQLAPPNTLTLRYDDPNDVYSADRWTKNGAAFVRWHSCPGMLQRFNHYNDVFWTGGTGTVFLDPSPRSDNYHHATQASGSVGVDEILQYYQDRKVDYDQAVTNLSRFDDLGDLTREFDPIASQKRLSATYLDYGTIVDKLGRTMGGKFEVKLDQYTGALVTGQFFTALRKNERVDLTFLQAGVNITFNSQDIGDAADHDYFDLSFATGTDVDQAMLAGLDTGAQHFIGSFADSSELPGLATFSLATGLTPDIPVNVYQYDAATGQFSLIAGNVTVDKTGTVTYRNNQLAQYLITTQTIQGATVSDMADRQAVAPKQLTWMIPVGIAVLLIAGTGIWFLLRRRRRV
jgi:hypothetical protein